MGDEDVLDVPRIEAEPLHAADDQLLRVVGKNRIEQDDALARRQRPGRVQFPADEVEVVEHLCRIRIPGVARGRAGGFGDIPRDACPWCFRRRSGAAGTSGPACPGNSNPAAVFADSTAARISASKFLPAGVCCANTLAAANPATRASAVALLCLGFSIHIFFPFADESPEFRNEIWSVHRQIVSLANIRPQVVQQQIVAIHEELPVAPPDGPLLPGRDADAPEERALNERGAAFQDRQKIRCPRAVLRPARTCSSRRESTP